MFSNEKIHKGQLFYGGTDKILILDHDERRVYYLRLPSRSFGIDISSRHPPYANNKMYDPLYVAYWESIGWKTNPR